MVEALLKFTEIAMAPPDKRKAKERRTDFSEIYRPYPPQAAIGQASRCSQCGVPFCQVHCPLSNNIPDWLKLAAEGRLQEAYELSAATNTFPEICGRICPQDRLCEGHCVIEKAGHGSVTIGAIEKFLTDTAFAENWVAPIRPHRSIDQSIGIIGAGPAGLAAAADLRRCGYRVTVYDRYDRAGGLMIYGIPNFKLDKAILARREAWLREGGIEFRLGVEIGRDLAFADLRRRHDAVLIATGIYRARRFDPALPGEGMAQPALDYLIAANRRDLDPAGNGSQPIARGKRVIVIGGGDTAMDCVRTAIREGAHSVTCLYRRDRAHMPGSAREVLHAEEEGVTFLWQSQPKAFLAGADGRLSSLLLERLHLGLPDSNARPALRAIAGSEFSLPADLAILALGFEAEDIPAKFAAPDLRRQPAGTLAIEPASFATALPGVFAAGDIVRGASLVVWAIRDGREAAQAIDTYLSDLRRAQAA